MDIVLIEPQFWVRSDRFVMTRMPLTWTQCPTTNAGFIGISDSDPFVKLLLGLFSPVTSIFISPCPLQPLGLGLVGFCLDLLAPYNRAINIVAGLLHAGVFWRELFLADFAGFQPNISSVFVSTIPSDSNHSRIASRNSLFCLTLIALVTGKSIGSTIRANFSSMVNRFLTSRS